jgi:hypothetical protein
LYIEVKTEICRNVYTLYLDIVIYRCVYLQRVVTCASWTIHSGLGRGLGSEL